MTTTPDVPIPDPQTLATSPAQTVQDFIGAVAQALANAAHNAATTQQQTAISAIAATNQGVITLFNPAQGMGGVTTPE